MKFPNSILQLKKAFPGELCDEIIAKHTNSSGWTEAETFFGIDYTLRKCRNLTIYDHDLCNQIFEHFNNFLQNYQLMFPQLNITRSEPFYLLEYTRGCFHGSHIDVSTIHPRSVSISVVLNDEFEGGELGFFDNQKKYNLKKGDVLVFPANFLYEHQVNVVTSGVRYSIVTWAN